MSILMLLLVRLVMRSKRALYLLGRLWMLRLRISGIFVLEKASIRLLYATIQYDIVPEKQVTLKTKKCFAPNLPV